MKHQFSQHPAPSPDLAIVFHFMLTPKEFEVLCLVAKGMSTREIAGKLFVSPSTVESHRKKLLEKFKARNSVELISKALKSHWLR